MNRVGVETAAANTDRAAVQPAAGIKPGNLPDAIIPIVPTRPDGSRDWPRQGWRALAVTRRRAVVFNQRLKPTQWWWVPAGDPGGQLVEHGVPSTAASLNRLIHLVDRLVIPNEYQDEVRSLIKVRESRGSDRHPSDYVDPILLRRKLLALNRSSGQFRNRLRRLQLCVEPLIEKDRRQIRPVFLAMNLVIDHIENLMEMHAVLPRIAPRHPVASQSD